jgi:hypothetical protein
LHNLILCFMLYLNSKHIKKQAIQKNKIFVCLMFFFSFVLKIGNRMLFA